MDQTKKTVPVGTVAKISLSVEMKLVSCWLGCVMVKMIVGMVQMRRTVPSGRCLSKTLITIENYVFNVLFNLSHLKSIQ